MEVDADGSLSYPDPQINSKDHGNCSSAALLQELKTLNFTVKSLCLNTNSWYDSSF